MNNMRCWTGFNCTIAALCFALSGCETGSNYMPADANMAPTCEQFRAAFRASISDFDPVRSGLEVSKSGALYRTFDTSLRMRGATSCVIRRVGTRDELYCRWEAGNDRQLMGAAYRSIRDQLKSCIRQGSVSQDDADGYTSIDVESEKGSVSFRVSAKYEDAPYYVDLIVRH